MKPIRSENLRRVLKLAVPFVLIPGVIVLGSLAFRDRFYAWISLVIVLLSQVLFLAGFEKRTVGTRRMVIAAVMTALSVLGRFLFAAIPGFKPITAMVVITAIWLGGETGFLVGSLSAVISNFLFGQGPWTPFQMLAWGMIGLIAGYFQTPLKKSRLWLSVYGAFAGVVYSLCMDVWTVVWYNESFSWSLYTAALVSSLPHTLSYAVSNVLFLLFLGRPFGEKLERIKIKYGV